MQDVHDASPDEETDVGVAPAVQPDAPASLVAAVLDEEQRRQEEQSARAAEVVLPDDLLPGVGAEQLGWRATLRIGGLTTILLVVCLVAVEQFRGAATSVLAPDIQRTFGITDTMLSGIAGFGGVALVLGAVPMAWLADRMSRKRLVAGSTAFAALGVLATCVVANEFQLFWAFVVAGVGFAFVVPVVGSLLSDQYPIQGRARVFAMYAAARPLGEAVGPFVVGLTARLAGGDDGWRWSYLVIALPIGLLAVAAALFMKDPPRGRYEQELVLGGQLDDREQADELPITMSTAYVRMKKIKTFYFICLGIGVLGFSFVAVPLQLSLLLEDGYGYGAFTRGWIFSIAQVPAILTIPIAGWIYDRSYRVEPERVVRIAGGLIVSFGVLMTIGLRFDSIALLIGFFALANACTSSAFAGVGPIIASVAPYRLRAQAFALIPIFIFLIGGFFGSLLAGALSDAHGERLSLTVIVPMSSLVGGCLFVYGARFLKRDISLAVEELIEEQAEIRRMLDHPERLPLLQVRNLDCSYGTVQVLFDVELEVRRGEVLALLGTNGAGKSTLLRAISGLCIPDRGVIRLNGRALTYVEAEVRFGVGVVQLRGGAGVFPELTVVENLRTALLASRLPTSDVDRRLDEALALFPALRERRSVDARNLSGGQQQMLALAMALAHEPEILLIDELSLGLAPTVLQDLLVVVDQLKQRGMTMIIVEQSLNVALAFADRAVFMEKGRIRFEGSARDLLERDDLAKAVFLGETRV
ncbi:MAG TPA: ATP-binding protein [Ilumatobacter sp.]|nr:ATP-binding protein [Ilumatobacter sp.]